MSTSAPPVVGDVLERHGHHTVYTSITELPYEGPFVERVMEDTGHPPERTLGVIHLEPGSWTTMFVDTDGVPTRLHLGKVIVGDYMVGPHGPVEIVTAAGAPLTIYCNLELFRCVDDPEADPVDPHEIYVWDGWKCNICGGQVDPSLSWPAPLIPSFKPE